MYVFYTYSSLKICIRLFVRRICFGQLQLVRFIIFICIWNEYFVEKWKYILYIHRTHTTGCVLLILVYVYTFALSLLALLYSEVYIFLSIIAVIHLFTNQMLLGQQFHLFISCLCLFFYYKQKHISHLYKICGFIFVTKSILIPQTVNCIVLQVPKLMFLPLPARKKLLHCQINSDKNLKQWAGEGTDREREGKRGKRGTE